MKKLIALFLGVTLAASVSAQTFRSEPFLAQGALILSNNTVYTFNVSSNILFYGGVNLPGVPGPLFPNIYWSLSNTSQVPTITGALGSQTAYYTNYALYSSLFPTNGGLIANSNVVYGNAWKWATVSPDRNGNVESSSIDWAIHGLGVNASNTVTVTLVPYDPLTGIIYTNAALNQFAPNLIIDGTSGATCTNQQSAITNILNTQLQGVGWLIPWKITVNNVSSSQGVQVDKLNFNQFPP